MLQKLNLPAAPLTIEGEEGMRRVLDPLRRRFVALTPEEWVRQHFVYYLIAVAGYPAGLMGNEVSIKLNGTSRRCDTVVYDRQAHPWMIVEYKAPHIAIDREVLAQALRYNLTLGARYITITNGMTTHCCEVIYPEGKPRFLEKLPAYESGA